MAILRFVPSVFAAIVGCFLSVRTVAYAATTTATQQVTISKEQMLDNADLPLVSGMNPGKARMLLSKVCNPKNPVEPCDLDAVHTFGLSMF